MLVHLWEEYGCEMFSHIIGMFAFCIDVLCLIEGYGIIKRPLLEITNFGVFSYHHGDMKFYRGMLPAFWELYNGETRMGDSSKVVRRIG